MKRLMDLASERIEAVNAAETIARVANEAGRDLTPDEQKRSEALMSKAYDLNTAIQAIQNSPDNTLGKIDPVSLIVGAGEAPKPVGQAEHPRASALKAQFGAWSQGQIGRLSGAEHGKMVAANPSGAISVGTGSGLDSIDFSVPLEVLPFMSSYFALDSFGLAGARVIGTEHMRPINQPVISAGATPTAYAEGAGPASGVGGSQPFGMSGFQFLANKYSRQVIADWEALMSAEENPQPFIIDELLASMANVMTSVTTTALYNALVTPPNIGGNGIPLLVTPSADTYSAMIALRHAVPPRFDKPTNKWMLSRATLAAVRNTRATSTYAIPLFDPNQDLIFGRGYVVNDYFDTVFGPGAVVYGSWNDGAWLRRTPCLTRVLQELYWLNNQIGYLITQWGDNHFLAELAFSSQPPSNQPLYYTTLSDLATS